MMPQMANVSMIVKNANTVKLINSFALTNEVAESEPSEARYSMSCNPDRHMWKRGMSHDCEHVIRMRSSQPVEHATQPCSTYLMHHHALDASCQRIRYGHHHHKQTQGSDRGNAHHRVTLHNSKTMTLPLTNNTQWHAKYNTHLCGKPDHAAPQPAVDANIMTPMPNTISPARN